jgi:hypothetical protein
MLRIGNRRRASRAGRGLNEHPGARQMVLIADLRHQGGQELDVGGRITRAIVANR